MTVNETLALLSWLFMILVVMCIYVFGITKGNPKTKKMIFKWLIAVCGLAVAVTISLSCHASRSAMPAIVLFPLAIFSGIYTMIYLHMRIRFCDECGATTHLQYWGGGLKSICFADLEALKRKRAGCWKCKATMNYERSP